MKSFTSSVMRRVAFVPMVLALGLAPMAAASATTYTPRTAIAATTSQTVPHVLMFVVDDCEACDMQLEVLESLAEDGRVVIGGIAHADQSDGLAEELGVDAYPTLISYHKDADGHVEELARLVGFNSYEMTEEWVSSLEDEGIRGAK